MVDYYSSKPVASTYQVGGSLPLDAISYVKRWADEELYQALMEGDFCCVLNSRQMGKSSLQVHTMDRLQQDGVRCIVIDLTTLGNRHITPEQWYASILHDLIEGFHLDLDFMDWWETVGQFSLPKRMDLFFEQVLLTQIQQPVVIFIDEIDSTLGLSFSCDDFFVLLRACYNRRTTHAAYNRLTFVLLGVATPSDFILDKQLTPFNIGRSIDLFGFDTRNITPLLRGLEDCIVNPIEVLHQILDWTGGQPFLTQKLCQIVAEHAQNHQKEQSQITGRAISCKDVNPIDRKFLYTPHVPSLIKTYILDRWESQDEPEHLRTIRNRLLHNHSRTAQLLGLYQRILMGEIVAADGSRDQLELRLSGLVVEYQGHLRVKNLIYHSIFNHVWVEEQLTCLRPYASNLNSWLTSGCQDTSCLLTGLVLKESLAWADQKYLSDVDYRFLNASQEQEQRSMEENLASEVYQRQQAQVALLAAEEASQLLAMARRQARQKQSSPQWRKRWIVGVALSLLLLLTGLRWTGWLQPLEWALLDSFVQVQPVEAAAPRLVVLTIDDADIQTVGQYPFADEVLVDILKRLKQHQPRLIGMDIFRDLPVSPGSQELVELYQTTPNLIGISKVVDTRVEAPPALAEVGQYGFADQVLDGDGVVRRGLLSLELNGKTYGSFALELALRYLAQEGIQPQTRSNYRLRLGQAKIAPLVENAGGYVQADTTGYQILLNYHGDASSFQSYSLRSLLNDQLPAGVLRDKIVLLGFNALTVKDLLLTPYSRQLYGVAEPTSGVFIHANIVHQLLGSALDNRPMMTVWPTALNYGWMIVWVLLGSWLGSRGIQRVWMGAISLLITCFSLLGISYFAYLQGLWIPMFPAGLGVILSSIILAIVTNRQAEQFLLQQTITAIMQHQNDTPVATKIALEYLKQGEGPRQQQLIESMEAKLLRTKA